MNPKKTKFVRTATLAMLAAVTSAFASAQDSSSSIPQDGDSALPITKAADSSNPLGGPPKPAGRVYVGLGSDRLFSLDTMQKAQLLFQMDLTEGYDDGIILFPTRTDVYYTLWTPRIALLGRTPKSEYVIQYSPTVSYFANTPIGVKALHQVSAEQHTEVSSYWGWDTSLSVANGSYPVSLLSGFNFIAIDNIAAVNIDSILLLSTTSYFNSNASVGLHWTPTPQDVLVLSATYNYANFPANDVPGSVPGHIHRGILAIGYTHSVSPRLSLLANGNAVHVFGPLDCTTYGGQFGATYKIREGTLLSGTVGPEFGSAPCSNSILLSYAGSLTSRLSKNWVGYLNAARTTSGVLHSSLGSGLTETYGAGITRQLGTWVDARVDAGYIRVDSLPTIPNSYNAQGKFISGRVDWTLAPPLELSLQYSRIYQTASSLTLDRNQIFLMLQWRPNPKPAF
jgi:hypothetical protein